MWQIGSHVIAISSLEDLLLIANSDLEASAGHVGTLSIRVFLKSTDGTLLELHLHHHQVFVVSHYLTDNTLTGIFPMDVRGNLTGVAFFFIIIYSKFIRDIVVQFTEKG